MQKFPSVAKHATMTKEEISALKQVLAETHTTERSGKYEAYKVAAYMRDKGREIISKIIEKHEANIGS